MPSKPMKSAGASLGEKMDNATSQTTQAIDITTSRMTANTHTTHHNIGPQPEDLPFDASPGTDEEFGTHAATMHITPKQRNKSHHAAEKGATDSMDVRIEGVLLSG